MLLASFQSVVLSAVLSSWTGGGLLVLAFLDSSPVFFMPLANDVVVALLTLRHRELFWLYPLLATAGAVLGSAFTYWVGRKAEEKGLEHMGPARLLDRLRRRVGAAQPIELALTALIPPPFPLTLLVLTCGALQVDRPRFFGTLIVARLLRYFGLALLALRYGPRIVPWFSSPMVKDTVLGLVVVGLLVTARSLVRFYQQPAARQPAGGG